jgi:hypothetical protein
MHSGAELSAIRGYKCSFRAGWRPSPNELIEALALKEGHEQAIITKFAMLSRTSTVHGVVFLVWGDG